MYAAWTLLRASTTVAAPRKLSSRATRLTPTSYEPDPGGRAMPGPGSDPENAGQATGVLPITAVAGIAPYACGKA